MADASEDAIRSSNDTLNPDADAASDSDPDESIPDYRFLSSLTATSSLLGPSAAASSLPRRGVKDFEPHPTNKQASQLDGSRQAMHDALSHIRVHAPKGHVVGVYDMRTGLTRVRRPRGAVFKNMGRAESGGAIMLWPEEALWALETGRLDVRWGEEDEEEVRNYPGVEKEKEGPADEVEEENEPEQEDQQDSELDAELHLVPMSLQGAYAAFLGEESDRKGFLTLERYLVYAGLKRSGFIVLRAEGWDGRTRPPSVVAADDKYACVPVEDKKESPIMSWMYNMFSTDTHSSTTTSTSKEGPLVPPALYRSYDEIYRRLHIIPCWQPQHKSSSATSTKASTTSIPSETPNPLKTPNSSETPDPAETPSPDLQTRNTFTTHFNVHRPSPHFRKSAPGPPDFRICVIDARATFVPTLAELGALIEEQAVPSATSAMSGTSKPSAVTPAKQAAAKAKEKHSTVPSDSTRAIPPPPSPSSLPISFLAFLHPSLRNLPPPHATTTPSTFASHNNHDTLPAMYRRLRTGATTPARNAILAVVDAGVISYIRFTEGVFGGERMWERVVAASERAVAGERGGKGGGGRGGRGRGGRGGRGRGRGGGGGRGG